MYKPAAPDALEQAKRVAKPPIPKLNFRIFVFGPGLTPGIAPPAPQSPLSTYESVVEAARYLRFKTAEHLNAKGFKVEFGETDEVLKLWQSANERIDLATMEMNHAELLCGAVIIYPSSVGSMGELGLFAPVEEIAKKTFALVHNAFSTQKSFLRLGLLEVLTQELGSHEYEDYLDTNACLERCLRFAERRYLKLLRDFKLVARGDAKKQQIRAFLPE